MALTAILSYNENSLHKSPHKLLNMRKCLMHRRFTIHTSYGFPDYLFQISASSFLKVKLNNVAIIVSITARLLFQTRNFPRACIKEREWTNIKHILYRKSGVTSYNTSISKYHRYTIETQRPFFRTYNSAIWPYDRWCAICIMHTTPSNHKVWWCARKLLTGSSQRYYRNKGSPNFRKNQMVWIHIANNLKKSVSNLKLKNYSSVNNIWKVRKWKLWKIHRKHTHILAAF